MDQVCKTIRIAICNQSRLSSSRVDALKAEVEKSKGNKQEIEGTRLDRGEGQTVINRACH